MASLTQRDMRKKYGAVPAANLGKVLSQGAKLHRAARTAARL
jgi:hypothetical protein